MNRLLVLSISLLFSLNAAAATCDGIVGNYSSAIAELARGYISLEKLETDGSAPKAVYSSAKKELDRVKRELIAILGKEEFQKLFNESLAIQSEQAASDERVRQTRRGRILVDEKVLQPFQVKYEIPSLQVTLTKDGSRFLNLIADANGAKISMHDFSSGQELYNFPIEKDNGFKVKMNPNEDFVGFLNWTSISLWNAKTGQVIYSDKKTDVRWNDFEFSPDGELIATKKQQGKVQIWNTLSASFKSEFNTGEEVSTVRFNSNGDLLLTAEMKSKVLQVWSVDTGKELASHNMSVLSAEWQPNGDRVLVRNGGDSFTVWDPLKNKTVTFQGFDLPYWSDDGSLFAASSKNNSLSVWPSSGPNTPLIRIRIGNYTIPRVKFSPDNSKIAGACDDGYLRIWRIEDGLLTDEIESNFRSIQWSRNGEELIAITEEAPHKAIVYLWHKSVNNE